MIKAANFIWSIYLLIMLDTLLLRPSLHFTTLHFHLSTLHLFSFKLHPSTLHYPLIWLNSISISYCSISPHITTLHLTSLHFTSHHYTSPRITTLHLTSLHFTSHHYTSPHITTLHLTSLHFTSHHCTSPHITTLHLTSLHFTLLHFTVEESRIISYQEVLSSLLKNVKHKADEAGHCNHSINGQLLRNSVPTGRLCFGALWNVCLSLNCDSWAVEGKLFFWISLVQSSLLSANLNTCFGSLVGFYALLCYSPIFSSACLCLLWGGLMSLIWGSPY